MEADAAGKSTRKDFKCLQNSLGFSTLKACPAFLMTTRWALSPKCLHFDNTRFRKNEYLEFIESIKLRNQNRGSNLGWTFLICTPVPMGILDRALPRLSTWAAWEVKENFHPFCIRLTFVGRIKRKTEKEWMLNLRNFGKVWKFPSFWNSSDQVSLLLYIFRAHCLPISFYLSLRDDLRF